jgi:sterol desaturase/sphingolipid hydroxylase (fatty acid hydroxylase superfamily)
MLDADLERIKHLIQPTTAVGEGKEQDVISDQSHEMLDRLLSKRLSLSNETLKKNQDMRDWLMPRVMLVALSWLFFTGGVIYCLAFDDAPFNLSDIVAVAFITTSLAIVLGLPAIVLHYFFSPRA